MARWSVVTRASVAVILFTQADLDQPVLGACEVWISAPECLETFLVRVVALFGGARWGSQMEVGFRIASKISREAVFFAFFFLVHRRYPIPSLCFSRVLAFGKH